MQNEAGGAISTATLSGYEDGKKISVLGGESFKDTVKQAASVNRRLDFILILCLYKNKNAYAQLHKKLPKLVQNFAKY